MNEITGYIEVPFHGEKGESAYDIAVKYGYEGTEEEWVDSLGFIPDKSIGEEKLSDAMVGKLREYGDIIGSVFEKKTEYKECFVNEYVGVAGTQASATADVWINSLQNYTVPYLIKGVIGKNMVLLPKLGSSVAVFDEANTSLWSTASGMYYLAKLDVSAYVGKNVKIYGYSLSTQYPLAFCIDENGNILERYGTDARKLYGYDFLVENPDSDLQSANAVEATIPVNAKYIYIIGGNGTSNAIKMYDAIPKMEVFDEEYRASDMYRNMQSPLWGKKLYVDGDSICYGNGYRGGFGKIIADKYNMTLINNAVGGATITNMGATETVKFGTTMDWENTQYYLKLVGWEPFKSKSWDGFAVPITKEQYEKGFGVYPTIYKLTDGEMVEQEYSEAMPTGTFFVKFDVPTYDDNTVEKYYRMWSTNNWLWEAYKSGFKSVHESGKAKIETARHWLSDSVSEVDADADYIVFEGGFNDFAMNRLLGTITKDMTSEVDTTTVMGGMEYICRQLLERCKGKKILFVITHKAKNYAYTPIGDYSIEGTTWTDYHDAILSVLKKYSIPCVDLFNNSAFNTELESYRVYTNPNKEGVGDAVHPTKEGYELFYVPQIVKVAESI